MAISKKSIRATIAKTEKTLSAAGIKRGRAPHTTRRIYRELNALAIRSPGFALMKKHTAFVKRFANSLAKALQEKHIALDRGLVNQSAIAHDSRRDFKEHDLEAKFIWAMRGAPQLAKNIGTGKVWTLQSNARWPIEKRILAYSDVCNRGVKAGSAFLNGTLLSSTAFRLLVSQRQANPGWVDRIVKERQATFAFEKYLRSSGIDPGKIIAQHMKRNPKAFMAAVEKTIDPNVGKIISASMKRLKIKRLYY